MLELIAEYVDRLPVEAEDRLLTTKLVPYQISAENGTAGCLVGVATGAFAYKGHLGFGDSKLWPSVMDGLGFSTIEEFNIACAKDPIGTAEFIRNRILENRAAVMLEKEPVLCQ